MLAVPGASGQVFYQNPVLVGDHPDPSIIRVGKDYWAASTSSAWGPLFPLLHSTDLVNWELTGAVLPHRPNWAAGSFWAPEISEYRGHYYVYYTARQRGGPLSVAVATAEKPGGPYTDHGPLVAQPDGSIDPFPATDTNGLRYLVWKEDGNSQGKPTPIWLQQLNDQGLKLVGPRHELIRNDVDWEGGVVEGPSIVRHNGWFYLFYSGNGCCGSGCRYALGVARSRSLPGPWEKNPLNPILAGNEIWKCPGHGTVVADPRGRFWLLYHAYSTAGTSFTGREGMLDEVKFGSDGWPTINANNGPSIKALSPLGASQTASSISYSDDFNGVNLNRGWQWPQHQEPVYHLNGGKLLLAVNGGGTNFLSAVLARATTTADYVATATIETGQLAPGVAVGLCAIGDVNNGLGVVFKDGSLITWQRESGAWRQLAQKLAPDAAKLQLRLTAHQGGNFELAVSADGAQWLPCGDSVEAQALLPWGCNVRLALTVGGTADAVGTFDAFRIRTLAATKIGLPKKSPVLPFAAP